MPHISSNVKNLIGLIDNESTTANSSIKDLKKKNFITDNMSLINFLTEGLVYLRQYNINITVIIKSLTEKTILLLQYFCKMKIQLANLRYHWQIAKRIVNLKFQQKTSIIEPITHLYPEKITKKKKREKKNEEQCYKKTLILEDYIINHVGSWRLNQRMKYIVSVCPIFGATTKAMKHHVMGCLEDESPDTIAMHHGKRWKAEKIVSNIINLALC